MHIPTVSMFLCSLFVKIVHGQDRTFYLDQFSDNEMSVEKEIHRTCRISNIIYKGIHPKSFGNKLNINLAKKMYSLNNSISSFCKPITITS